MARKGHFGAWIGARISAQDAPASTFIELEYATKTEPVTAKLDVGGTNPSSNRQQLNPDRPMLSSDRPSSKSDRPKLGWDRPSLSPKRPELSWVRRSHAPWKVVLAGGLADIYGNCRGAPLHIARLAGRATPEPQISRHNGLNRCRQRTAIHSASLSWPRTPPMHILKYPNARPRASLQITRTGEQ